MSRKKVATPPVAWRFPRILLPSLGDCFFFSLFIGLYAAGGSSFEYFLLDGDTGWHIRTGDFIFDHHRIPCTDPFSFSREGAPWFAWEWLSGLILAALHRALGLKGVVFLGTVLAALYGVLMLRAALVRGASVVWAVVGVTLGLGAASVHFLARPHLFTLAMLAITLQLILHARTTNGRALWWLVPMTVFWANVHPGFVAGIAILLLAAAGAALEAWAGVPSGPGRWRVPLRFLNVAAACLLVSLINPYGFELHRHIAAYLSSSAWLQQSVTEFAAPRFRGLGTDSFQILLFTGLIVVGSLLARREFIASLWILFWGHQALASARHIPIFVLVTVPFVAEETTRLFDRLPSAITAKINRIAADLRPGLQRFSAWSLVAVLVLAAPTGFLRWPQTFPSARFPIAAIDQHADLLRGSRTFTTDEWADYLIYRLYPDAKVFLDGRSDFYGPEMMRAYETLLLGRPGWNDLIDRYHFNAALLPPGSRLVSLLRQDARWRVVDENPQAILFVPAAATSQPAAQSASGPG